VCEWMSRLVEAEFAAARQRNHRNLTPPLVSYNLALYLPSAEKVHGRTQVVAHEEETVLGFFLGGLRWMDGYFRGWEGEDQPTVSRIHVMKFQNVTEEPAVSFGIGAVKDDMRTRDWHPICSRTDCSR